MSSKFCDAALGRSYACSSRFPSGHLLATLWSAHAAQWLTERDRTALNKNSNALPFFSFPIYLAINVVKLGTAQPKMCTEVSLPSPARIGSQLYIRFSENLPFFKEKFPFRLNTYCLEKLKLLLSLIIVTNR